MTDFKGDKLPGKPSDFIRYAVQSVVDLEDNGHYIIDLSVWEEHDSELDVCRICLSGATALKARIEISEYGVMSWNQYENRKYRALAYFAAGEYYRGLRELNINRNIADPYTENPHYAPDEDYEAWKQGLLGFAAHLESKGY